MLTDVQRAIAWARKHAAEHGGDPSRIVLTGGSAGGHLAALAALAGDPAVRAAVPLYGRFDFIDRNHLLRGNREAIRRFEGEKVMPPGADDALWDRASPIAQVRGDAPPMLVIHGRQDCLLPAEEAAAFVVAQRGAGGEVDHVELSGGQHAFDVFESALTAGHVRAARHWLSQKV
jgi:acetyl esterase/lipase